MSMDERARAGLRVRYWAGAAQAAGCDEETLALGARDARPDAPGASQPRTLTGQDVRALVVAAHPGIEPVLARCSLLHAGRRLADDAPVDIHESVEVLPPFVGG